MKNGVIQNWGLVEFKTPEEAEETLEKLDGSELHGHQVRKIGEILMKFCLTLAFFFRFVFSIAFRAFMPSTFT